MNSVKTLYREIKVWEHLSDKVARQYACFEDLINNKYYVQSCDWFYLPLEKQRIDIHLKQLVEFFIEVEVSERMFGCDSLLGTVEEFKIAFGEGGTK